jgi:hypothetical protein
VAGQKSSASWLCTIPGFRSRTAWKSIAAVTGYLLLAFSLVVELSTGSVSGMLLVLGVLLVVLVAANAWDMRMRLPMVKSPNKLLAATGWCIFFVVWLAVVGLAAPPSSTTPSHTALAPSTAATPTRTVAATSSPSATATATASPTASPTAAPTKAPVIVVATPKPTVRPTQKPPPPPPAFNYCGAPANPWHYNFCSGNVIYAVPSGFCSYFPCIPSFWNQTNGYAEECVDGKYSHSGGRPGACSYHHGELRPLLQ